MMVRSQVRRGRGEAGVATTTVLVLATLLCLLTAGGASLGGVLVGQRRLAASADLGVLAGAAALQRGRPACPVANRVVARNAGRVTSCHAEAEQVRIEVAAEHVLMAGMRVTVRVRSHAGPIS